MIRTFLVRCCGCAISPNENNHDTKQNNDNLISGMHYRVFTKFNGEPVAAHLGRSE